jgi:hypothetical protein
MHRPEKQNMQLLVAALQRVSQPIATCAYNSYCHPFAAPTVLKRPLAHLRQSPLATNMLLLPLLLLLLLLLLVCMSLLRLLLLHLKPMMPLLLPGSFA